MYIDYPIAVIGAGIIGAGIAARLTSLGISVALIDKGAAGSLGASSYSGGLVRLYDSDPLLMELAAMSIGLMDQGPFANTFALSLQRTGAIYRAAPDQLDSMRNAIEQHASGRYPMRLLASHEPGYVAERVNLFEPHACVGNVRQAVAALAAVVRRDGLLLEHCALKGLDCRSRDEVLLDIGQATLRCRAVVIAAGAWSQRWLPPMDLQTRSIPLARVCVERESSMPVIDAVTQSYAIPLTRYIVQTGCGFRDTSLWPEDLPLPDARHAEDACARIEQLSHASDFASALPSSRASSLPQSRKDSDFHDSRAIRGHCGRQLAGDMAGTATEGPWGETLSRSPRHQVLDVLQGFDSYTPDGRPFLGFTDADSPVYLATGMSGLGFKFAPAIAEIAAEHLQRHLKGQAPGPDWCALSPARLMQNRAVERAQP